MAYIYNMADTWADAGVTFTAIKMNVLDTASNAASLLMDLQTGGVSRFSVAKGGIVNASQLLVSGSYGGDGNWWSANFLGIAGSSAIIFGADVQFRRDGAANTLAQRNGTNAQAFRVYNTFTDASNYERGFMRWSSNVLEMGREFAGTGVNRDVRIRSQFLYINVNSNDTFTFGASSHISTANIIFGADNTFDIGASGTSRPRNLYLGSNLLVSSGAGVGRTSADIQFYDGAVNVVKDFQLIGKFLSFSEQTAPAAPATNDVRVYAEDNGSGKTRLMARFATGAAVQIAIEP